ncbi:MAG: Iron-sulfur assembly protein 1 [Vezdaea acicularis]|nr:MAG: Iron-sulfur assembly protein 1 [Vezdaea acicularis]
MSIPRFLLPLTSSQPLLSRFASASTTSCSRPCTHALRTFSSSQPVSTSSRRQLQTITAHRPHTLDSLPVPPRNSGIPNTSIAGGIPEVNETRAPNIIGRGTSDAINDQHELPSVNLPELKAQESKPTLTAQSPELSTSPSKPQRRTKLRPRKAAMTLTPSATLQLRSLLSQPEPKMIRVGVKNRGCSGLAYHLEYVEKPGAFDESVEQDGVKVLIDSKALFSIIGSEMDWIEDKLNRRFVFRNPNIKEQCGCGESFMV